MLLNLPATGCLCISLLTSLCNSALAYSVQIRVRPKIPLYQLDKYSSIITGKLLPTVKTEADDPSFLVLLFLHMLRTYHCVEGNSSITNIATNSN